MLPLSGPEQPVDHSSLSEALRSGFQAHGLEPKVVTAVGGRWPKITSLAIDLTGAEASRALRPPRKSEKTGEHLEIETFEFRAHPLSIEKIPVIIDAHFNAAEAEFAQDGKGVRFLQLRSARSGEVDVTITHADLEKALLTVAAEAASKHGAEVKSARLEIETPTPRTLVFRAAVTAKVFIMKTTVRVRGRIDLDDALNAQVSELVAEGEGMLSSIVESGLRPHLAKLEREKLALGSLVAGGLRVSDVAISAGATLRLHATFAGATG
ncbi:MAG: hypothetical protein ABIO94_04165 [Opitutaceae bacterium]